MAGDNNNAKRIFSVSSCAAWLAVNISYNQFGNGCPDFRDSYAVDKYKVLGKKEIINKQPNRESQSLLTFTCFQLKR